MRTPCDLCDTIRDDSDMWRITRRPDDPEYSIGTYAEPDLIIGGPQHRFVCPDCWHAFTGWCDRLAEVRKASAR